MASSQQEAAVTLRVSEITKQYGERAALAGVSFEAHRGELLAVIGPNGAGKTTLLSILAGTLPASGGSVETFGQEIGWVPQQPALYGKLTVVENLRLFARLEKLERPEEAVDQMLDLTSLGDRSDELVHKLSGGNRQRINIALGLLGDPAVLLLDEPSSALDPRQRARLWEFVAELAQSRGTTVVYSTHYVQEAETHATRVLVLDQGRTVFEGTPAQISAQSEPGTDFESSFVGLLARLEV